MKMNQNAYCKKITKDFWDTAEIYAIPMREETYGETENIIGEWFKKTKKREKMQNYTVVKN